MRTIHQAQVLRAIPPESWPQVLAAGVVAALVEVGLRLLPLDDLSTILGVPLRTTGDTSSVGPAAAPSAAALRRIRATRLVMRNWPFGNTCLRHALVLGNRLRDLRPELRVGVARVDGEVRAHAWLEIDGRLLDPIGGATGFQPLTTMAGELT